MSPKIIDKNIKKEFRWVNPWGTPQITAKCDEIITEILKIIGQLAAKPA
jgi:hypothetical protein